MTSGDGRLLDRKVFVLVMEDGDALEITAGKWLVVSGVLVFVDEFGEDVFHVAAQSWRCVYPKAEDWRIQHVDKDEEVKKQ